MRKAFNLFEGEIGRAPYIFFAACAFFSQHLLVYGLSRGPRPAPEHSWLFWLNPFRALTSGEMIVGYVIGEPWIYLAGLSVFVIVAAVLTALTFRRAATLGRDEGLATLAAIPFAQVPVILWFWLAPARHLSPERAPFAASPRWRLMVVGFLVGAGLSVVLEALSTLVFRTYGWGLFFVAPLSIGLSTAYLANRGRENSENATFTVTLGALALGGLALIGFALEGVMCLVIASPLIAFMGLIGAFIGRALARRGRRTQTSTAMSVAFTPLFIIAEAMFPPKAGFTSVESIDVAAPSAAVWDSIVHMGPIPGAPSIPFRWGLAYPVRGRIFGSGVGAIRQGVFSTGIAYERVTRWEPDRRLDFIVLSDPPSMRELSPYAHVNAPHVSGYFRTLDASFTITPLASGKTRLSLATRHELDLEPALYWLPIAQWATHANKVRVLDHFRDQAEAEAALTATP